MALSDPRGLYGVHSVTPYNRTTGKFYGTLKVVKSSTLSLEGTLNELMGGSSKFPWAVEDGEMKVEASLKFGEFPNWLFNLFLGNQPTQNAAEASGTVGAPYGVNGSTIIGASGIATVQAKVAGSVDLKFMKYVVVAASATTVDVFAHSDEDFARGAKLSFVDDSLKITATPLTITSGGVVEIPFTGVTLTGGTGPIAMTVGDSFTFGTRPINTQSSTVRIGGSSNQVMPEFGMIVMAQRRGNGQMMELDCFRCKGSGFPLSFEANAWAEAEVKVKAFYDSVKDGVFDMRHVSAL